jgi:glycerol-3-phosphate dehydrogenase
LGKLETEILVIGGGATGTGVLRDLAMRGFKTILVERRDLTNGTTGRFHGLLHSGARYVVKDPEAARECIEENRILRKIMPHCIEDTGGYFVLAPGDDPSYRENFTIGCQQAGIPAEKVSIRQMLAREQYLNPEISQCYYVPDAAADSFAAAHANVNSAKEYGARVFTYYQVNQLLTETGLPDADNSFSSAPQSNRVVGALCHDIVKDQAVEIHADIVINAAGAWVGKIGHTAGVEIAIRPGKGTMIAVSHRIVNTVINRLKMPSDGDILVPAHTVAVMGTTDEQVPDPDSFSIEPWEVQHMLNEGEKIIPGFSELRILRAWAGVRPLYQETKTDQSRNITRSFVLLDHEERDNIAGLLTITSGKWTTYRKMAEVVADKVCEKLGTQRACRTHLEELPNSAHRTRSSQRRSSSTTHNYHHLGDRLAHIEREKTYGTLICECELATRADIERAIIEDQAKTLDDIRRDVRLGMGPCQGAFCTFRAAGILHALSTKSDQLPLSDPQTHIQDHHSSIYNINASIRDFLQERWKGLVPVLWGQQLRQERFNELICLNVLNIDHLPGPAFSRFAPESYQDAVGKIWVDQDNHSSTYRSPTHLIHNSQTVDTLVIGAGLAGLTAAWQLSSNGQRVRVITKGWGATHWASGCIDLIGYYPIKNSNLINAPVSVLARLVLEQPNHPYAQVNMKRIDEALKAFQDLCAEAEYPLQGSIQTNWLLPTAAGAIRPTCLAPETFVAGDLSDSSPMLLVGINGYPDFYPHLVSANLESQGYSSEAVIIQLPGLRKFQRIDTMVLARYFNDPATAVELAEAIKPHLKTAKRVGLPAVLGMGNCIRVIRTLESILGCRVFEIPGLPPSVPGMRLHQILVDAIQESGGQILHGLEVINGQSSSIQSQIESIYTESASRPQKHTARNFILATGGILGGGISSNHAGKVYDPIFDLQVKSPPDFMDWAHREFLHPDGQPIMSAGVQVRQNFQTEYENLYAIGGTLSGDFVRERSLEGVGLVSGYHVAEILT